MGNSNNNNPIFVQQGRDLQTLFPDIASHWHPTANGPVKPCNVSAHSNRTFFWICDRGHTYDSNVHNQVSGQGCPYCSNRRLLIGFNDLKTRCPDAAIDWDYDLNENGPENHKYCSTKPAYWKCSVCGHQWTAKIRDRVRAKYGCPECAKKHGASSKSRTHAMRTGGIQDPLLLKEWDYEKNEKDPSEYAPQSNDKVWWVCSECGCHYQAQINNRYHGRNCPCCRGRIVVQGINDLATTHPELAKEWHPTKNLPLTPEQVTYGRANKVWWICPEGHEYQATILHRASGGTNCPICNSGRQTSFAEQAVYYYVKKVFPNAINHYKEIFTNGMELDIYIPDIKLGIEYDGVYWHKKAVTYDREKRKYDICKKNGIKLLRIREGKTEDNKYPAADYSIFMPDDENSTDALTHVIQLILAKIDPNSNPWTRKNLYHFWSDVNVNIDRDKYEIFAYLHAPVENSVFSIAPELITEWDYERNGKLKPEMIKAGSSISANWICSKCGYRWIAQIASRAINHTGCPKCAGFVFEKGVNDLATMSPELLEEWDYDLNSADGLNPTEIQYNSSRKAHWICSKCGHKWVVSIRNRSVDGRGCIKCGYESAKKNKNEKKLEEKGCITNPLLLKEWDYEKNSEIGLDPKQLSPGSNKQAYWICSTCGYKWKAPIARRSNGAGCRKCADKANPELQRQHLIKSGHGLSDPTLLREWDYEKNEKMPADYSYGSGEKVFWICSTCGHSWQATINSRHRGAGCPACAGNILVPGKNDLLTMRPSIAAEWDYSRNGTIIPECVSYSLGKKYWWICPEGHDSYLASPSHRIYGTGCPICGNQKISLKNSKTVEQLSLEGTYIRTYPNVKFASQECGVSSSAICNAIRKGTVSAGYKWKYSE